MRELARPRTCNDLAETFGGSPQRIYYHIKVLERAGFVEKVAERRVRGLRQGIYRASAYSYWLSPELAGQFHKPPRDDMGLSYLLELAEQLHIEVGALAETSGDTPNLAVNAQIELAGARDRSAFLEELQDTLTRLAEKYGARSGQPTELYRLMVATYPIASTEEES